MKKIIISDFDDTIYINNKISDIDIKNINRFRMAGNLFVIATGSSYTSFLEKTANSGLKFDYLIVNHGSGVYKNNNLIFNDELDINVLKEIINRYDLENKICYNLDKEPLTNFLSTSKEGLVSHNSKGITKIHLKFNEEDFKNQINYLRRNYDDLINIYEISHNRIEIITKRASKLFAIDRILKIENILDDNVYTIGDGYSDIEMIKRYKGYAMKNSISLLKQICIKEVSSVSDLINDLI